jgi:restriction endonuclease S subunit
MPRADWQFIGNQPALIPPLAEQRAIAAFLDRETANIDSLVAKKRRLVELLREKRTALISRAVTKGLNPAAPMKPSGTDWLGDVPKHWETKRLKFVVSEPLKYGANEAAELDERTLPRYIRITDVDEDGRLRDETFKSIPEDVARPYLLRDGDVLLARSGATVGKSFYYDPSWGRAAYAGYLIRARVNPTRTLPRFVSYFMTSSNYWQWLNSSFIQATIQNVSAEKYANLMVPMPPLAEQRKIVAHMDEKSNQLSGLIAGTETVVGYLKEYRSALISAAVTGKIDVRYERGR